jgi:hypothetical protein
MHCLAKMRMALQEAREGKEIGKDWTDDAHWPHCLDYLRSVRQDDHTSSTCD